jgi:hypothetical protein
MVKNTPHQFDEYSIPELVRIANTLEKVYKVPTIRTAEDLPINAEESARMAFASGQASITRHIREYITMKERG